MTAALNISRKPMDESSSQHKAVESPGLLASLRAVAEVTVARQPHVVQLGW